MEKVTTFEKISSIVDKKENPLRNRPKYSFCSRITIIDVIGELFFLGLFISNSQVDSLIVSGKC